MNAQILGRLSFLIDRYRVVSNVTGTILVSWLLSAIAGQMISFLLPNPDVSSTPLFEPPVSVSSLFPPPELSDMSSVYLPICERNIFDSQKRTPCSDEPEMIEGEPGPSIDLQANPIKSDMAATLLGTMVSTNPNFSFASIAPKSGGESKNYRLDDMIMNEGKVYDIERNRVYFIRNGHKEFLEVENLPSVYLATPPTVGPAPGEGVKVIGDKAVVSRAKVEATLGDLNEIIQQARMVPNYESGAVNGFKIFAIRPGSIFQELGLQNGDVIHRINGSDINSVEKAIPMLQLARNESSIAIDLTRRGQKKTMTIEIQ